MQLQYRNGMSNIANAAGDIVLTNPTDGNTMKVYDLLFLTVTFDRRSTPDLNTVSLNLPPGFKELYKAGGKDSAIVIATKLALEEDLLNKNYIVSAPKNLTASASIMIFEGPFPNNRFSIAQRSSGGYEAEPGVTAITMYGSTYRAKTSQILILASYGNHASNTHPVASQKIKLSNSQFVQNIYTAYFDNDGEYGNYRLEFPTLTKFFNTLWELSYIADLAPEITGPSASLGNKTTNFTFDYSVLDYEKDSITSKVTLNGTTLDTAASTTGNIATRTVTIPQNIWDSLAINTAYNIVITATDSKGNTSRKTHTFTKVNAAPTAQLVEPRGDAVNVPIVDKTQPILVWNFKDTDIADVQSAYQVVIEDINGLIVHDSTKKIGTASYYQVPINLEWTKTYKWKVTVWDKYDVPSNPSEYGFFKPNRAPNLTGITPGSTDKLLPSKVGSTPVYTWTFEDLDVEAQAGYQLQIFKTADDSIVYNTNRVSKNVQTHTIPENVLLPGVEYYAVLTVWDPNNLSATSEKLYIATNATPSAPTLTRPIDNFRTLIAPTLAAVIGTDPENDKQHFKIQLSQDKDFASGVVEFSSLTSRTGWKVDGFDIPVEGVDNSAAGKSVELTLQTNLEKNKTYYWRMAAIDTNTQAVGKYSTARKIRVGNRIEYDTLKRQIPTNDTAARRILVALDYMLAKDGTKPSEIKVFVSNNAMDVLPTWEDATTEFLRQDYYTFTNATKTAATFGVGVKVVIEANDSMEPISINAAGITFD